MAFAAASASLARRVSTRALPRSVLPFSRFSQPPVWRHLRQDVRFVAGMDAGAINDAASRPRKGKKKGGSVIPQALGATFVVGGAAYFASEDVQQTVDGAVGDLGELFEDFNDSSREVLESIGDRIVTKRPEPWLLDLATMKYPENIPTLILDVDKVILYLEHDSVRGWQAIKRPFADQFFKEISHYYEVVLFSDDVFPVALDIATKWSLPVTGVLHRDFCKKKRQHYVKDLSKLGRRLDRVLMLDHDEQAYQLNPDNGILIKPFTGETDDCELLDLLEFLKAAATTNGDIRQFAAKFRGEGSGDVDVGRRYLLHKQDQDAKVESRRSVGRFFAAKTSFPDRRAQTPGLGNMR